MPDRAEPSGVRRLGAWLADPPLPGGPVLRTLVAVLALLFTWADLPYVAAEPSRLAAAVGLLLYLPLLGLAVSIRTAAVLWILLAAASILVLPGDIAHLGALSVVGLVLTAAVSYSLPLLEIRVFWAAALAYLVAYALLPGPGAGVSVFVVFLALTALAAVMGRLLARFRHRAETEFHRAERLSQVQKEVRAEERQAIAHELHDIVAHDVTAIVMQARRARFVDDAKRQEILGTIGETGQSTLDDLRRMLMVLRRTEDAGARPQERAATLHLTDDPEDAATVTAVGLTDTIDRVVDALRAAGMTVEAETAGDVGRVPTVIRQSLRRVVRELGTNIMKHADPAHPVTLHVAVEEAGVSVRSRNRIAEGGPVMSSGTGVEALRTRVDVYGGTLSQGVTADDEWVTRIWLPFVA